MPAKSSSEPITRTFRDLHQKDDSLYDYDFGWEFGLNRAATTWAEVLASKRILLVSEAGAGKTHECEQEAKRLIADGVPAFWLRLERVAEEGIEGSVYGPQKSLYAEWKTSASTHAYFFFDSIDELQLTHWTFRQALERASYELSTALNRCVIVVTSRPVDIDRDAFKELLPVPVAERSEPDGEEFVRIATHGQKPEGLAIAPEYREVKLLPLTDEQVIAFARLQKVADPESMWAAINERNAQDLARWPQELIELCDSWRANGRISNYLEQLDFHAESRLKPRRGRREKADLSLQRAKEGAQKLALAAVLGRRLTFRVSPGSDRDASSAPPLDPRALLLGWEDPSIEALLERPVFAEGGDYGRARFRHRSVMEFLAARQIQDMVNAGHLAVAASNRLLFGLGENNQKVLRPSMRPIAGWLAMFRADTFETLLREEPSALLTYGDPSSLTSHQRERALTAFVTRYGDGKWRGLQIPEIQLDRLADASLADTVLLAWDRGIENPEVRELLLKLIGRGRLSKCADLAASVAQAHDTSDTERFDALVALTKLEDKRVSALVEAAISLSSGWSERTRKWVTTLLYPQHVSDAQVLQVLKAHRTKRRDAGDLARAIARLIDRGELNTERQAAMLEELAAITNDALEWSEGDLKERQTRLGVSSVLRAVCVQLLKSGNTEERVVAACSLALQSSDLTQGGRRASELRRLVELLPQSCRPVLFKSDLATNRGMARTSETRTLATRTLYQGALFYSPEKDIAWMLELLKSADEATLVKEVLLRMVVSMTSLDDGYTESIQHAVSGFPKLITLLDALLKDRQPTAQILKFQADQAKRMERQRLKNEAEKKSWKDFWTELAKRPAIALAPGRLQRTLFDLAEVLRNAGQNGESRWDRPFLEETFGETVTDSLRKSLMTYWRSMRPTVKSERELTEKSTYKVVWTIGLMGIYAEAEDSAWCSSLSAAEADSAARYALLELNGLPSWLVQLSTKHPKVVTRVLSTELDDELKSPGGDGRWHSMLLQSLRYGAPEVAKIVQDKLVAWLDKDGKALMLAPYSETTEAKLDQVIRVLMVHGDPAIKEHLTKISAQRAGVARSAPYLRFWLPILMHLDPRKGIEKLLSKLASMPVEKHGDAVQLLGSLFSERRPERSIDWSAVIDARTLLALCLEFYRHVREKDDADHDGAYSPGSRDWAENGRRVAFDALIKSVGPEAMECKLELSRHPLFERARDRIVALAIERSAAELDSTAWAEKEVAEMLFGRELAPRTVTDMAHVLTDRLDDLQELMLHDTGPRMGWSKIEQENDLRPLLANFFLNTAKGAYTVEQEPVTADNKEVDVRLTSVHGPRASIELKIGEKSRSAKELVDTVQDQLVTKYMGHSESRAGCLLVTVAKPDKRWGHPTTKRRIDRIELQALLEEAAKEAQLRLGGEARVVARILDLTPRLPTEAKARRASTSQNAKARPAKKSPSKSAAKRYPKSTA